MTFRITELTLAALSFSGALSDYFAPAATDVSRCPKSPKRARAPDIWESRQPIGVKTSRGTWMIPNLGHANK